MNLQNHLIQPKQIIDKLDEPDTESDEEYDPVDECYDKKIDFGSRKIKHPTCNCDICSRLRVCLLNYQLWKYYT